MRVAEQQVQQQHARTRAPSLLFTAIRTRGAPASPEDKQQKYLKRGDVGLAQGLVDAQVSQAARGLGVL